MPELPEAETWRRLMDRTAVGRRIVKAKAMNDRIIFDQNAPSTVSRKLKGLIVTGTHRHGKHVWLSFDQPGHLYIHFGMSGSMWALQPDEEAPSHLKLDLTLDSGVRLVYRNMRRIGKIRWLTDATAVPPISKLGPDPFSDKFTVETLETHLSKRKAPIKAVLLDQKVFAGVGNWIADEVLYQSKINPNRKCTELSSKEIQRLHRILMRILRKAVENGADSYRFPKTWLFHYRWGKKAETTHKNESIQFDQIGGRTTAWVPEVQK